MRGSVYYQTSQLAKHIFKKGALKYQKTEPGHPYYKCVSSYKTMETYRRVWDNFGNYLKEHWKLKDFEKITDEHIDAYISYKIEYYPSKQYLEKIVSSLGKLQDALERFSINIHGIERSYDFSIRQNKLHYAKVQNLVADGYHSRVYQDPLSIIENLEKDVLQQDLDKLVKNEIDISIAVEKQETIKEKAETKAKLTKVEARLTSIEGSL